MAQPTRLVPSATTLEVDLQVCGLISHFEGGDAVGNVVKEQPGSDGVVRKHIAGAKYEDLVLAFGADMSPTVYDWIAAMLGRSDNSKNGAVVLADGSQQTASRLEFLNAVISEVTFPALDGSSKDPISMQVRITPEFTRSGKGAGSSIARATKARPWLGSNFRLQIDGLDCSRVNAIGALTVSRATVPDAALLRGYEPSNAGPLDVPNLAFTIAESGADALIAWHQDFVIQGKTSAEKNGTLQFLAPNLKDVLFTLNFSNLGIFKLARVDPGASAGALRRLRAEMYCERLDFLYGTATAGAGTQVGTGQGQSGGANGSNGGYGGGGQDCAADGQGGPSSGGSGGGRQEGTIRPVLGLTPVAGSTSPTGRFARLPVAQPQTVTNALDLGRPMYLRT